VTLVGVANLKTEANWGKRLSALGRYHRKTLVIAGGPGSSCSEAPGWGRQL
jgi:hypothetical protein